MMSERYPNGMHPNCAEPCPMCDMELVITAARDVVKRWDTAAWMDAPATAVYINALRDALTTLTKEPQPAPADAITATCHEDAQRQIANAVHLIQVLCGNFGYDPCEWLNDETAIEVSEPKRWLCAICGGNVALVNASKPTILIGGKQSPTKGATTT